VCERLGGTAVRELDSPCKLADSAGRTEFMHPTRPSHRGCDAVAPVAADLSGLEPSIRADPENRGNGAHFAPNAASV
jgi:hypothetical protein